ncbi:amidohydrolase family protein [Nocardia colli]|uniref:Amidohydrolase family protein n=2 Tax=Nocardia colli TaxID=2545717 RepID=A0A5N0EG02_9NOCA|nr:amidohydrolase family protein [Nocardia colli]
MYFACMIIRNVTVIDGSGAAPIEDVEVVVTGERFTEVRPSASDATPADGEVIDGRGGYLIPGLWESHTHLAGYAATLPEPEQVPFVLRALADFRAAGIAVVVDLGGSLTIDHAVRQADSGETAKLFYAGPVFTGIEGWPLQAHGNPAMALQVSDPDHGRRLVLELAEDVDFVKFIYDGEPGAPDKLSRRALHVMVEAAHEAGKKALVHIRTHADIEDAVAAGADCVEHAPLPSDDLAEAGKLADLLANSGTYYCPTLVTWEQLGHGGDLGYLQELLVDGIIDEAEARAVAVHPRFGQPFPHHPAAESMTRFRYGMRTLPIMHAAGVKIVAGSDVSLTIPSPPLALLRELQLFAKAGLPAAEIIVTATRHAAERIAMPGYTGTITAGSVADALLLDRDPLADLRALSDPAARAAIIHRGRVLPRLDR